MNDIIAKNLYQEELYKINSSVMIVLPTPWHKILDEEKALLTKILSSVKTSIDSVLIVQEPKLTEQVLGVYKPGKVLLFGSSLETDIKSYERHVINGVSVIKADELGKLDDVKKKNLWVAMKQMFGV
ncbi:hypothetical protein [Chryseosolibacter indicus]|uniref:Uncharacterized protein n=1 Tax=Chryseosolibacter indicus TaxID=2782351 RepID=A0ABS5VQV9_9BACT|nr:hypothetical protein [Chryseosolibacter indicus]MBT1702406.1 hypothetical protein [Chryseosolibacter indicus]